MLGLTISLRQWEIIGRTLIGGGGGYVLSAGFAVTFAEILPLPRSDAGLLATMLAFLVLAGALVWAFGVRKFSLASLGILVPMLFFIVTAYLLTGSAP